MTEQIDLPEDVQEAINKHFWTFYTDTKPAEIYAPSKMSKLPNPFGVHKKKNDGYQQGGGQSD